MDSAISYGFSVRAQTSYSKRVYAIALSTILCFTLDVRNIQILMSPGMCVRVNGAKIEVLCVTHTHALVIYMCVCVCCYLRE